MFGEQGTIRAIRVIRGENGLQDWPQRGAEGTKRSETVGFCHRVHGARTQRQQETDGCGPRNTRKDFITDEHRCGGCELSSHRSRTKRVRTRDHTMRL